MILWTDFPAQAHDFAQTSWVRKARNWGEYVCTQDENDIICIVDSRESSMHSIIQASKKTLFTALVFVAWLSLWLYLCYGHWNSYWNGTIYRVQTTDFNMLHHTMPATLSQMIIAGRDDLIQTTLDSTYGLFGIAVTDPSGQAILYQTDKMYRGGTWQEKLTADALLAEGKKEPPDLLTDPPPMEPIWEHASPRDTHPPKRAQFANSLHGRKVLGYVYYIRSEPPSFVKDITSWLGTGFWELSGAKRGYFYVTAACIAFGLIIILLIWLRQRTEEMKQLELKHVQKELEIRKKALDHLSAELASQRTRKIWLEKEAEQSSLRAAGLREALMRLKDSLSLVNVPPGSNVAHLNRGDDRADTVKTLPPSSVLEEIERLIPALTGNADALKSQATLLQDYCAVLEQRQSEMKRIVEYAYTRTQAPSNVIDMHPLN